VLNRPRIENDVRNLAWKLFTGLEYLHSLGIGHRDIKFENIIVSSTEDDATPKFIDFGLSKVFLYGEYS
jgi:serine/threonine protein kinase